MELALSGNFYELTQDEMERVEGGGFPWGEVAKALLGCAASHPVVTTVVVGAAAGYACAKAGYAVGEKVGEFIYNVSH